MSKNPVAMGRKWAKEILDLQYTNDRDCPFEASLLIPEDMNKDRWISFAAPIWANGYLAGKQAQSEEECADEKR